MDVAERIAAPQRLSKGPSTSQSGPYLIKGAEKIQWIFPLPLRSKSQTVPGPKEVALDH